MMNSEADMGQPSRTPDANVKEGPKDVEPKINTSQSMFTIDKMLIYPLVAPEARIAVNLLECRTLSFKRGQSICQDK